MKKLVFVALVFVALFNSVSGQSNKIKKADLQFSNLQYKSAINTYERVAKKDANVWRKLAAAYKFTGNASKALKCLQEIEKKGALQSEDILLYAEVLKMNANYAEANAKMNEYALSQQSDSRSSAYLKNKTYHEKLLTDQGQFAIKGLNINSSESDFGTSFMGNQVVFASSRMGLGFVQYEYNWNSRRFLDLYSFTLNKNKATKVKALRANGNINGKYHEGPATFSADGNYMVFTRDNYSAVKLLDSKGTRTLELWYATKNKKNQWSASQPMPFNNKDFSVGHASLTADGKRIYFVSDMPGGLGQTDIYYSDKMSDGSWGAPVNAGNKINTEGKEMFPFIHESGILFFASDGHPGIGGLDIFYATAKGKSFGNPVNVGVPVNGSADDFAFILDKEMKNGYFSSDRKTGKGSDDIYRVDVLKPFKVTKRIEGVVTDKFKSSPLPGATVHLYDENNQIIATVVADEKGQYAFDVEPDKTFTLESSKDGYYEGKKPVSSKSDIDVIKADIQIEKIPEISLLCLITDKQTNRPLPNATLIIKDKNTGKEIANYKTTADGLWHKDLESAKINDKLSYEVSVACDGYLTKKTEFNHTILKEGEIKIHENLDLAMNKLEVGMDLAKLIDIKPIYFDLGKYNIRPDAALELDKIVAIMKEYPNMVIELGSHTDCRSSASFNLKLSDNRAKSSAQYIVSKGIDSKRISGKGFGETKLLNGCACEGNVKSTCSEEEHQRNRRTEFIIVKM